MVLSFVALAVYLSIKENISEVGFSNAVKYCTIKGNVSADNEKIYHEKKQEYYKDTKIEAGKSERIFCNTDEAEKAGFRKSKAPYNSEYLKEVVDINGAEQYDDCPSGPRSC